MTQELKPIVNNDKTSGQFVLDGQVLAKEEGFAHVNKSWYQRTKSFDEGLAEMEADMARHIDLLIPVKQIEPTVNGAGKFVLKDRDSGIEYTPRDHALSQIGSTAQLGTWYPKKLFDGDELDNKILAIATTNGFRKLAQDKKYLVRVNKEENSVRALLSEKYSPIGNHEFLSLLKDRLPGGRLSHWDTDANTIVGNILLPDSIQEQDDSEYGFGVSIGNSEVGMRRLSQYPFTFRAICFNGNIWGKAQGLGLSKFHKGVTFSELKAMIIDNIEKQLPMLPHGIERLLGSRGFRFSGSIRPILAQMASNFALTKKQAQAIYEGYLTEKNITEDNSLFMVLQSLTRGSQALTNALEGVKIDEIAGEMMFYTQNKWERLVSLASELDTETVEAAFSVAV